MLSWDKLKRCEPFRLSWCGLPWLHPVAPLGVCFSLWLVLGHSARVSPFLRVSVLVWGFVCLRVFLWVCMRAEENPGSGSGFLFGLFSFVLRWVLSWAVCCSPVGVSFVRWLYFVPGSRAKENRPFLAVVLFICCPLRLSS